MKKSKIALALLTLYLPVSYAQQHHGQKEDIQPDSTITVTEIINPDNITTQSVSAEQLRRIGASDFGSIMRYQPLISAPGSKGGSQSGKSSFDRSGYTGYNIRGLDGNRVSMDVDGIPLPDATGRSYDPFTGENTFGIGRDYIDPYLYALVNISSGGLQQGKVNNVVGGGVSFISKSPDDYLLDNRDKYFSYTSGFNSADNSLHNGVTSAFGDDSARILLAYSRRDGQQVRNNSGVIDSYPARWNSDSFLIHGSYSPNIVNHISGILDYYHKSNRENNPYWKGAHDPGSDEIIGKTDQKGSSQRYSLSLKHELTPDNHLLIDKLATRVFYQQTRVNDKTVDGIFDDKYKELSADRRFAAFNPHKSWTFSGLNTKNYGVSSEITKQYGIQELNYGARFSKEQTQRPFNQIKIPDNLWTFIQPQGDSSVNDLNLWLGDNISMGAFSVNAQLKYSWREITPKGIVKPSDSAIGALSQSEVASLYNKKFSDSHVLPSLTVIYALNNQLSSWIQYKRAVSYPTTSQMFGLWLHPRSSPSVPAMLGNPDLKSETSNQFEWGITGDVVSGVSLRTSVFYNSYDNFIANKRYSLRTRDGMTVINPVLAERFSPAISDLFLAENRDKAYIYGAELSSKVNYGQWFPSVNGLSNTFAIGYNKGKAKSSYPGDGYIDIDSVLPMKAVIAVAWDDPQQRYGVSLAATFVKGKQAEDSYRQNFTNRNSTLAEEAAARRREFMHIAGYGALDLAGYYNVTKNITINAGIYNVTNRKYLDYASNKNLLKPGKNTSAQDERDIHLAVATGRNYQLGISASF